jgi:hypothetical protein
VLLELSSITELMGLAFGIWAGGMILLNGLVMLVSPRRWLDLPPYIGLHGSFGRSMLLTLGGRLRIRLLGVIAVTFVVRVVMAVVAAPRSRTESPTPSSMVPRTAQHLWPPALGAIVSIGAGAFGLQMVLRPEWCFERYCRRVFPELPPDARTPLVWASRVAGVITLVLSSYMAWSCLRALEIR